CNATCTAVDPFYSCNVEGDPCEKCGNGGAPVPPEVCDDGNNAAGDGCRPDCSGAEPGWVCIANVCYECGDGVVSAAAGEICDDGNRQGGDGCSANCKTVEPNYACPNPGQLCQECGNGAKESSEQCDDGNKTDG